MTPDDKRLLADTLMDSAVTTADEAAALGLRDIPEGALETICNLSDISRNALTKSNVMNIVHDRITLRMEELANPAQTASEARDYARRETELYRDLLSNIFASDGLKADPQRAGMALSAYNRNLVTELQNEGRVTDGIDVSMDSVEVPTFSDVCRANNAGRAM